MNFYFYGVLGPSDAGHFLYASDGSRITHATRGAVPFTPAEIDGKWCTALAGALPDRDQQHEGVVYVHHARGWTIVSWWDRSGDGRHGSCAVFLAEGERSGAEMLRLARERYPREIARMERRYTLTATPEPRR